MTKANESDLWSLSAGEVRRRVPLPTYPFAGDIYDLQSRVRPQADAAAPKGRPEIIPFVQPSPAPRLAGQPEPAESTDPVTRTLAELWATVLGIHPRPADNFFDQGASSFFAIQLCSQVRDRLGVPLAFHALLERPTFSALAEHVRELRSRTPPQPDAAARPAGNTPVNSEPGSQLLVTFQPGQPRELPLFLIQPAGGTVFSYAKLAHRLDHRAEQEPRRHRRDEALEHRQHLFGLIPYAFLIACPLLHFFHGGHHHGHRRPSQGREP